MNMHLKFLSQKIKIRMSTQYKLKAKAKHKRDHNINNLKTLSINLVKSSLKLELDNWIANIKSLWMMMKKVLGTESKILSKQYF